MQAPRQKTTTGRWLGAALIMALIGTMIAASQGAWAGSLKQQGKLDLEIYGIITRALLYADDGDQSQLFHVDGGVENTRLGFAASAPLTEAWEVGGVLEYDIGLSNPAGNAALGANGETNADTATFGIRLADIAFRHKRWGTFSIGQGDTASTDRVAIDLSGTDLAAGNNPADMAGGINFYDTATGLRAVTIGDVFDKVDGIDKDDRIRYDTPEFRGVQLATSWNAGGSWDLGAGWAGEAAGTEWEAGAFVANTSGASATDGLMYGGSVAAKHASGFSLAAAGAVKEQQADGRDAPNYVWGKIGYSAAFSSLGETHVGVSYGVYNDFAQNGDEATELGFAVVQDLEAIGSNIWLLARNHQLDRSGAAFDDIFIVSTGVVLNF